uniref:Enhancer of mRNA-decapping protein 4 WD40 repeat region domain-containing protein n=1 Tax=Kalanchoe fedtschenkoi TaxID=63787 RepID=A0A7N0U230_KALFE
MPYPPPPPSASYPPPTGPYSYPPQQPPSTAAPFHHQYQYHHQFHHQIPNYTPEHPHRSISFPTPVLQPPLPPASQYPSSSGGPSPGVRLMAMLSAPPSNLDLPPPPPATTTLPVPSPSSSSDFAIPSIAMPLTVNPAAMLQPGVLRMPSSKLPKGRHLVGDPAVYDIDVRLQGEVQPQLEVTPITKYNSDPQLVVGRQIAVNKTYICYGLKMGNIRVLNINTALRSLLKGHNSRVSDTAFFADDVHLLASASVNGRFYVWKLSEGPDEEDKPQITGKIVVALQVEGGGDAVHPRVCWHCHKQEVLVVGMGTRILRLDTTKVGKGEAFSAEEPLKCPIDKLIDGVQFVGMHEGEVTDLSMCQWMTTRLVSASTDGTIKIWEDRKAVPILSLRPHDGHPVSSATFLSAPHRPDHIILITGGYLNQEIKFWASGGEEGWLLPSDAESWKCIQTLKLSSSSESKLEEAFFNQVVALSQPGLLLVANAKKNAIYAVHIEYGSNPASTRMDYIAEFTVTMPILSFTGTSDLLPNGEHIIQLYCVQTQAIQQYALNMSQCLPPPMDNSGFEKVENVNAITTVEELALSDSSAAKPAETLFANMAQKPRTLEGSPRSDSGARKNVNVDPSEVATIHESTTVIVENKVGVVPSIVTDSDISHVSSPPHPLSPRLSSKLSGFSIHSNSYEPSPALSEHGGDVQVIDYSVDRQIDNIRTDSSDAPPDDDSMSVDRKAMQNDTSNVIVKFNYPTPHLITPSEIFGAASSSDTASIVEGKNEAESNIQDVVVDNDSEHKEVDVKVVGETGLAQDNISASEEEPHDILSEPKEKYFCSQASDLGIQMARECRAISSETYDAKNAKQIAGASDQPPIACDEVLDSLRDALDRGSDTSVSLIAQQTAATTAKGKKQKGKNAQASGPSSPSPSVFNSSDSISEQAVRSNILSVETVSSQIQSIQETLNKLLTMQKETQKQTAALVAGPITKEGKRLEATIGRTIEKALKANSDALWARFQEEIVKNDKVMKDRLNQITTSITGIVNKDMPPMIEKAVKKELATAAPSLARTITPVLEKSVSSSLMEAFQRGVGDKLGNQLEKSVNAKLEATVARQIQAQFQTSGKQALQVTSFSLFC